MSCKGVSTGTLLACSNSFLRGVFPSNLESPEILKQDSPIIHLAALHKFRVEFYVTRNVWVELPPRATRAESTRPPWEGKTTDERPHKIRPPSRHQCCSPVNHQLDPGKQRHGEHRIIIYYTTQFPLEISLKKKKRHHCKTNAEKSHVTHTCPVHSLRLNRF